MKLKLDNISTSQDLSAIIYEVRKYAKWYAQTVNKIRVSGQGNEIPPAIEPAAAEIIRDWDNQQPLSQASLDELIASLEELAETSPQITITLAALPSNSLKQILAKWCRDNIDAQILVDFRFNATILGGMVVKYGSHVYDWSFRRQILAERNRFPEVLRRV